MIQRALRTRFLTLSVTTTGLVSLASSATGGKDGASAFTRAAGSFYNDEIYQGMEIVVSGFAAANNGVATVTWVTPTVITVDKTLTTEAAAVNRSLVVGAPSARQWENVKFNPKLPRPYVEEQYLPGPVSQDSLGPNGWLTLEPQWVLNFHVPEGAGIATDSKYLNAVEALFAPRTAIVLANTDILRVRSDVAPFRSQRQNVAPGWVVAPIAIPLRLQTQNSI